MKTLSALLFVFLLPAFFQRSVPPTLDGARQPNVIVGKDKAQCPMAAFSVIQDAVNAANPGAVIRVCPGTYAEQVVIEKSLSLQADNGVVVMPANAIANTTGVASGEPLAALILVKNTQSADIEGFIIDGANNGITECSPFLIGILYQNSSGKVKHNAVRHMNLSSNLDGCQSGDGIDVQSSPGNSSTVEIEDNSVHDYQKNGITGNESGTTVAIRENVVNGIGPTSGAAQNGIQVGFGAQGSIEENRVGDNIWAPCVSLQQCQFNATGILVFESDGVKVSRNTVGTNQVGIFIGGQNANVENNDVFNSQVLVGIELMGNSNTASHNRITHSDQAAVLVQGNDNQVRDNKIIEAGIGILKVTGFSGNIVAGNVFFATTITVQDPAAPGSGQTSPVR